ncbi:hypothetical protein Dda_5206 [Drechslerella dactyloides]|uniref:Uncharacterized protein n=1 Tax=Drechslerella dactyloides TaxID=74499 RepID=A0AAD6NIH1_DREDA|nr:hypothetical protein Dda_5206 [Drechslerella dactyloides]
MHLQSNPDEFHFTLQIEYDSRTPPPYGRFIGEAPGNHSGPKPIYRLAFNEDSRWKPPMWVARKLLNGKYLIFVEGRPVTMYQGQLLASPSGPYRPTEWVIAHEGPPNTFRIISPERLFWTVGLGDGIPEPVLLRQQELQHPGQLFRATLIPQEVYDSYGKPEEPAYRNVRDGYGTGDQEQVIRRAGKERKFCA